MTRILRKRTKARTETSLETLRQQRIIRVRRQNEALALSLQKTKGELVNADELKQEVLRCNQVVKQQLLSLAFELPPKLMDLRDPRAMQKLIHDSLVKALNDLAYERLRPVTACPVCGQPL
jgi:hypothetical protein